MVKIANIADEQLVYIPREREEVSMQAYTLTLTSVAENTSRAYTVTDEGSAFYFAFRITLPEPLRPGEYTYKITRSQEQVATGLCIVTGTPAVTWKEGDKAGRINFKEYGG